ncbi:MAG: hypothetical protein O5V64_525 [Wigglesworthia glossinidia]|nr:hypothetical protein [Wigglesworthia glossinidia]
MNEEIILIDGSIYLYRAYYGLPNLKNKLGQPIGAIYGMISMIKKILKKYTPYYVAIIFDSGKTTNKHKIYKLYKENRNKMPDNLHCQIPAIKKILKLMGLSVFSIDGIEADDVIGSISKLLENQGKKSCIFTNDKDMMQLVSKDINIIHINSYKKFDPHEVYLKYRVFPHVISDYLALVGDVSDNIPGVPGIGKKTASILLTKFYSIQGIYNNLNIIKKMKFINKNKIIDSLISNKNMVYIYHKLTKIDTNIKINFSIKDIRLKSKNYVK